MAEKSNRGKFLVIGGLLLLLVIFPAVSWYYLRTGLDYRVTALGELGDYGKLPSLTGKALLDGNLINSDLNGKVVLTSFFNPADKSSNQLYGENLGRLHDQFDERDDLLFLNYMVASDSISGLAEYAETYDLIDKDQVFFLQVDEQRLLDLAVNGFHAPGDRVSLLKNPLFVLADSSGTIRSFYHANNAAEVKRMVEHIALILPYQGRPKPVVKREKEK